MRISTGYQFDKFASQVSASQARLFDAQRQISTGKRIEVASDDPSGTRALLGYKSLRSGIEQYSQNLGMAKGFLSFTEEALGETAAIMRQGYEFALRGANSSTDQIGRNAMADEVSQLQRRLADLANTQGSSGNYIFGGHKIDAKPFTVSGSSLIYGGDAGTIRVEISPNDTLPVNSLMGSQFVSAYQELEDLKSRLLGGDIGGLSGVSIPGLQDEQNAINLERGRVGVKLRSVEEMIGSHARRAEELTSGISGIEDVDLTEAIVGYKQAETAYQAALQAASLGYGLSLMDFIRG